MANRRGNRRSRVRPVALGVVALFAAAAGFAPSAHAGSSCTSAGCSRTANDSSYHAVAYRNWCRGGDITGAWTATRPTCTSGKVKEQTYYLAPHTHTPWTVDWDAFQVDPGWCVKVRFVNSWEPDYSQTYDRRGKSAVWVKVADNSVAHITAQSPSHC
ncbi:hypothetical protein [Streptomyces sp. HUAS TT7]|uniref:hypothetical protein n=1 Tax=Streptomyces sp. HUAS TT7 TaxID=3447507 RepID=UPI003F657A53